MAGPVNGSAHITINHTSATPSGVESYGFHPLGMALWGPLAAAVVVCTALGLS